MLLYQQRVSLLSFADLPGVLNFLRSCSHSYFRLAVRLWQESLTGVAWPLWSCIAALPPYAALPPVWPPLSSCSNRHGCCHQEHSTLGCTILPMSTVSLYAKSSNTYIYIYIYMQHVHLFACLPGLAMVNTGYKLHQ